MQHWHHQEDGFYNTSFRLYVLKGAAQPNTRDSN